MERLKLALPGLILKDQIGRDCWLFIPALGEILSRHKEHVCQSQPLNKPGLEDLKLSFRIDFPVIWQPYLWTLGNAAVAPMMSDRGQWINSSK